MIVACFSFRIGVDLKIFHLIKKIFVLEFGEDFRMAVCFNFVYLKFAFLTVDWFRLE